MMYKAIKSKTKRILEQNGWFISNATPESKINELIKRLYPFNTQLELTRLGSQGDGGYLVPNDLENITACFSPGVDVISDFELDCYKKDMKIFMADKSVSAPNINLNINQYDFIKKFIGPVCNDDFITMDQWFADSKLDEKSELILQMDIEGAEYLSLINMSEKMLNRFRIMTIEFHTLNLLFDPSFFSIAQAAFDILLKNHTVVHSHPNNGCKLYNKKGIMIPDVIELTFLRNDRITERTFAKSFPHPLDADNTQNMHMALPRNWYA